MSLGMLPTSFVRNVTSAFPDGGRWLAMTRQGVVGLWVVEGYGDLSRANPIMACGVVLYSADAGQRSHWPRSHCRTQDTGIHGDRHFLVLWFRHGESRRIYFALARHGSRSYLGSQSDSLQAARASGRYGWDSLPAARREPRDGRNRVVSTPPLGMEIRGRNHRHSGPRGCR